MSIHARHTVSGVVTDVPENIFNHVELGQYWVRVDEDAKSFLPEMHVPTKAPAEGDDIEDEDDEEIITLDDFDPIITDEDKI